MSRGHILASSAINPTLIVLKLTRLELSKIFLEVSPCFLTSAIITVELFADTDDGDPISYYFYGPFQTFSEKLPYVPSYLKLMRLSLDLLRNYERKSLHDGQS